MGAMESLYVACTTIGTLIFGLIFINYFVEASANENDSEKSQDSERSK